MQVELTIIDLFNKPIVREIVEYVRNSELVTSRIVRNNSRRKLFPLTPAQHNMYVQYKLLPDTIHYNIPYIVTIKGDFSIERLKKV